MRMTKNQSYSIISKSIPVLFACYFLFLAFNGFREYQVVKYYTAETTGVMTQTHIVERSDSDSDGKTKGVITYTVNDKEITKNFTASGEYHNLDEKTVYYNPDDPEQFSLKSAKQVKKRIAYNLFVFAILVVIFGVSFWRKKIREENAA